MESNRVVNTYLGMIEDEKTCLKVNKVKLKLALLGYGQHQLEGIGYVGILEMLMKEEKNKRRIIFIQLKILYYNFIKWFPIKISIRIEHERIKR
ncbi:MAG TPA: hypothetical protein VI815_02815 [Candidatus Nanoarchaeia archaeon]|nr:hypothetical protein [Candidatus Nanoarchaeia archaeon]